jgi:hypothetical protein
MVAGADAPGAFDRFRCARLDAEEKAGGVFLRGVSISVVQGLDALALDAQNVSF